MSIVFNTRLRSFSETLVLHTKKCCCFTVSMQLGTFDMVEKLNSSFLLLGLEREIRTSVDRNENL